MPAISSDKDKAESLRSYRSLDLLLYTVADIADIVQQPYHRIYRWVKPVGTKKTADGSLPPIISSGQPEFRGGPTIPFVGLVQAQVAAHFFQSGMTTRRIRLLQEELRHKLNCKYVLACQIFSTYGAGVLSNYGIDKGVLAKFLKGVTYGENGYATRYRLTRYKTANVIVDSTKSSGQPIFKKSGVRLEDALKRLQSGQKLASVASDFKTPREEIQEARKLQTHGRPF